MQDNDRDMLLRLINAVKNWGDHSLSIEKRVELLMILNKFLGQLYESGKLSESMFSQYAWRKSLGIPPAKA